MATSAPAAAGNNAGSGASAPAAANARKPRDPNKVRKASPKVKALNEVRTYMIQHRAQVLQGKTGVERDIEAERFERMLDSVEALFPPNHGFTIKRESSAASQPAAASTGQ